MNMRAGGFTVQQALSVEAASVIKQAVQLARRRGHAQVTPLHVASIMLYSTTGLLRTACLQSQSHSHPLQCKALELCFNVALNRLPASSSSTGILGPPQHPSISNALVAAFKRAQAHQRRGSIENQQQPLLAVKIEIQQLIVSILDDPSVSRVMREAGFSSTLVKSKLEEHVSLELCSRSSASSTNKSSSSKDNNSLLVLSSQLSSPILGQDVCKQSRVNDQVKNEYVIGLIGKLLDKNTKSLVIVGEDVATMEDVVQEVIDQVDKGAVSDALKEVKFISLPLLSFKKISRGEVEEKLEDLIRCIKTSVEKGVVLYLGDLEWIVDYRASNYSGGRNYYCSVEHMIVELGKLAFGLGENGRFRLMGIGSSKTYMKCKTGNPSLESVWGLQALTVPAGGLCLSLTAESSIQDIDRSSLILLEGGEENQLTCCAECSANFDGETRRLTNSSSHDEYKSSTLPSWLKDENKRLNGNVQENLSVKDLCKKWNSFCSSSHKHPCENTRAYSSSIISPSSSASYFSYDQKNPNFLPTKSGKPWPVFEANMITYSSIYGCSSSDPNSTYSSDNIETEYITKFREFNAENLKILCKALEKKVPWQKDIIPEIAGTILQCRSGMLRRKEKSADSAPKTETWFSIQGVDRHGKEKFARELAKVVFGSSSCNFTSMSFSKSSSTRSDSVEDHLGNKRSRDELSCSVIDRFAKEMSNNPHRVFYMEDVEEADYCSQLDIKRSMEGGKLSNADGDEVSLADSIVVLSYESFSSSSRACSPLSKGEMLVSQSEGISPCMSLDLNISFEDDDDGAADMFIDDIGLIKCVDRCITFETQEL